jgi:hypothetical protein
MAAAITLAFAALAMAGGPVEAASCSGSSHQLVLSSGSVSPSSGGTSTLFAFRVRYEDNAGCAPSSVIVKVSGAGTLAMTPPGGADYQAGATFSATLTLPAGVHSYSFTASSGSGKGARTVTLTSVNPTAIAVAAPPPPATPRPTPTPTPRPTPAPTARAQPVARVTTKPTSQSPRPRPTSSPTPSSNPSASPNPFTAGLIPGADPLTPSGLPGSGLPIEQGPSGMLVGLGLLASIGGFGMFGLAMARRRRKEQPIIVVETVSAPALASGPEPTFALMPTTETPTVSATGVPAEEMAMPRWRRPSLRDARQSVQRTQFEPHNPVLFRGDAPPDVERRIVRYRIVRVTDAPDELLGSEVGNLGEGDEVEILERKSMYLRVRTPTGLEGWVHRTTLDEVH